MTAVLGRTRSAPRGGGHPRPEAVGGRDPFAAIGWAGRRAAVDGSDRVPTTFEEYWTFRRPVDPEAWRLTAIQHPPA